MAAPTTPAEGLRAAARLLRETASKATPGPWEDTPDALWIGGQVWGYQIRKVGNFSAGDSGSPDPAWIALASPAIAPVLVDWLEDCADEVASTKRTLDRVGRRPGYTDLEEVDEPDSVRHALRFARLINGRTP